MTLSRSALEELYLYMMTAYWELAQLWHHEVTKACGRSMSVNVNCCYQSLDHLQLYIEMGKYYLELLKNIIRIILLLLWWRSYKHVFKYVIN